MDIILLSIRDVPGTSRLPGFEEQIEIMSYSHGVDMQPTGDVTDTERTPGKPRMQDFHLTKYLDKSSPLLNQRCCEGTNLGEVRLTLGRNDNGALIPLIVYTMSDAVISSVHVEPVESLTFSFSAIKWDYTARAPGGTPGVVAGSWDAAAHARK